MDPVELMAQGKIKRFFRATRKLTHPGITSHITQRAVGKEPCFLEDDDYLFMLGLIKETAQKKALTIFAFCLMANHVHLLVRPEKEKLHEAMRNIFSHYATRFNRKYERKGHLFAGPYRQAVCLDEAYLLAASVYIHLNPVRARLQANPLDYRWSSSRLYCEDKAPKSFVRPEVILRLLSPGNRQGKAIYRALLEKGTDFNIPQVLEQQDAIERLRLRLASAFPLLFKSMAGRKQVATMRGKQILSTEELERQIRAVLKGSFPGKPETRKAKKFLIEQLIARGYKRYEIAERLQVSPKTVYNLLKSSS